MDNTYYFVSYFYGTKDGKSGHGSIEITIKDGSPFVPSEVVPWIEKRNDFKSCVIINWKQIDKNQWCGEDNEGI